MSILESTIASIAIEASGDLRLVFSNGDTLSIYKEPQYTSYRLRIGSEKSIA
jgi:hypothetical protein